MTDAPAATVRPATRDDLPVVAEIAAHHVLHTVSTFQTEPLPLAGWEERWESLREAGRPFLVVTVPGAPGLPDDVAGFAYVGAWRERPAYAATGTGVHRPDGAAHLALRVRPGAASAERALEQHGVEPPAVLEADPFEPTDLSLIHI